jgi:hypothetical protein
MPTIREILYELVNLDKNGGNEILDFPELPKARADRTLASISKLILECVGEDKIIKQRYYHRCYAGSTVCIMEAWTDREDYKCPYKIQYGQGDWPSYGCTQCNGISKGFLESDEWQKREEMYNQAKAEIRQKISEATK